MAAMAETPYPVRLDLDAPLEVARWRPLVHWLLAIPQFVILYVLNYAMGVVVIIAWFAILFTGNIPEGMFNFMVMVHRYQWRVYSYMAWLRQPYPPFEFQGVAEAPGTVPARLSIDYPDRLSRGLSFA